MPWTIADVDRFKRGLGPTQKRRWVRVANSALASCQARQGRNCEASAIRQANGVVGHKEGENMEHMVQANGEYVIRNTMQDGRKYLIVPVVMMVEGVHNGSAGSVFHSAEELARNVTMWERMPVTIEHPQTEDGFVSVQDTDGSAIVGEVHNATVENRSLKGEIWLDVEELSITNGVVLDYVEGNHPLEVSVGIFTDDDKIKGNWNGEHYETIARNHRPDHLALLPGGTGACSWEDGCGIRSNMKGGKIDVKINEEHKRIKSLSMKGNAVWPITTNVGFRELTELAQRELDRMDRPGRVHFLKEMFDDYVIYEIHRENEPSTLYRQNYQINTSDGGFELTGDVVEVRREVNYIVMEENGTLVRTKFKTNKNKGDMEKKKEVTPCCEERIDQLIANEQTRFAEKDKEWLMTLEEAQVEAMFPKEVKAQEKKDDPPQEKTITKDEVIAVLKESMSKPEDYINLMPKEMQDQVRSALVVHNEQRASMIKGIIANTAEGLWSEESLSKMDTNMLTRLYNSVKAEDIGVGDYSGLFIKPSVKVDANAEEPLSFPGMTVEETKEEK